MVLQLNAPINYTINIVVDDETTLQVFDGDISVFRLGTL